MKPYILWSILGHLFQDIWARFAKLPLYTARQSIYRLAVLHVSIKIGFLLNRLLKMLILGNIQDSDFISGNVTTLSIL